MTDYELVRLLREAGQRWRELQTQKDQSAASCDDHRQKTLSAESGIQLDEAAHDSAQGKRTRQFS